jgi:hypothetical protein
MKLKFKIKSNKLEESIKNINIGTKFSFKDNPSRIYTITGYETAENRWILNNTRASINKGQLEYQIRNSFIIVI